MRCTTAAGLRPLLVVWTLLVVLTAYSGSALADTMTLNLKDASIGTLIETMAEITGRNFVVDPRVKGKVTVISARPMDRDEIYKVFQSILAVHGFATVKTGEVVKIVPDVNAKQSDVPLDTFEAPGVGDELVTRVISVEHVSAAQLVPILRPLIPQQGHLAAYAGTNTLVISDRAANVDRIVRIVRRIDLATEDEVELIRLEQASAAEVVRVLSALQQEAAQRTPGVALIRLAADERTNSVLLSGPPAARMRMRGIIAHLDTPLVTGGNTHVIYLRYANAKDLISVLGGIGSSLETEQSRTRGRGAGSEIEIQADEAANALVITAPPDVMKSLRSVIQQLDIRRAQVLVEGIIAEVSMEKAAELGVQFRVGAGVEGDAGGLAITNFNKAGTGLSQISTSENPLGAVGDGLALGYIDGTLSVLGNEILDIRALLKALRSDASTNVLSTPSLMTLDNEEAEIVVGQNVPFVTGSFTSTVDSATNPFQTIQRQDIGITLRVRPQINEGDAVKLDIQQEVSSLAPSVEQSSDLITNKRSIKTTVMVDDGDIVVLGGLIDDSHNESVQKVPVLGDIPVLGALFRYKSTNKIKRNLMVFIRPQISRTSARSIALTTEKYNYIRARELVTRERGVSLMTKEESPLLPTLEEMLGKPSLLPGSSTPPRGDQ